MNKLIIIESGDRLGKTTLIRGLCEYFDYKNICVRHCDKPPKFFPKEKLLEFQMRAFDQEFALTFDILAGDNSKFIYHNNTVIYDRFYLGEYVYGQMFRNYDKDLLKNKIEELEKKYLSSFFKCEVYLITLTAEPTFFLNQEDGKSFSQTLEQKIKELELFKEIHNLSHINHKLLLKVDYKNKFKDKSDILNNVINFISKS